MQKARKLDAQDELMLDHTKVASTWQTTSLELLAQDSRRAQFTQSRQAETNITTDQEQQQAQDKAEAQMTQPGK